MTTIKTIVHNRRIDVPAPGDIPDGAEVTLTIAECEQELMSPDEIARVLTAMQQLPTMQIPAEIAADLDEWERRINQRGLEHRDPSLEYVFP